MIIDGVCIRWRGYIDLERLDGIGGLEYDEDRGRIEDAILRQQIEQYKLRMREFEERQRLYKLAQAEHQKKNNSNAHNANNNNNGQLSPEMSSSSPFGNNSSNTEYTEICNTPDIHHGHGHNLYSALGSPYHLTNGSGSNSLLGGSPIPPPLVAPPGSNNNNTQSYAYAAALKRGI